MAFGLSRRDCQEWIANYIVAGLDDRRGQASRPTIRQPSASIWWLLWAVCPDTGHAEELLNPELNTKIVNSLLELFLKTVPEGEHAVMIGNGTGFHTSKSLPGA